MRVLVVACNDRPPFGMKIKLIFITVELRKYAFHREYENVHHAGREPLLRNFILLQIPEVELM